MEVRYQETPFPHIIVRGMYDEKELADINVELDYYVKVNNFLPPTDSFSAKDNDKNILKNNLCIQLDEYYQNRESSIILKYNRKLFCKEIIEAVDNHWSLRTLKGSTKDITLLSYYEKSHYYKPHYDRAHVTALTWFMKDRTKFTGGDVSFPEFNYTIEIENNMSCIFPGAILHSVSEVNVDKEYIGKGFGRWVMSQFITYEDV